MNNITFQTRNKKYTGKQLIFGDETLIHCHKTKLLGEGDNGTVYETDHGMAVKEQILKGSFQVKQFIKEAQISKKFADLHLGPKIYTAWLESSAANRYVVGKLLMEKIVTTYEKKYLKPKNVTYPDAACQEKIVALFEHMIQNGYLHEDNHVGNIGFLKNGQIVLIDFAFARKLPDRLNSNVKANLLALTLYIMIDKYKTRILNTAQSVFYRIIYAIRSHKYKFGTFMRKHGVNLQC